MTLNILLAALAVLSFALMLWQWLAARRFPLHARTDPQAFPPAVALLKPLKGCDPATEDCLRSWFAQDYTGRVQLLFGVASAEDPVCAIVRKLLQDFPASDAQLILCSRSIGANAKVSKLAELKALAKHDLFVISDADVRVPPDFLTNVVAPLRDSTRVPQGGSEVPAPPAFGLVNCFYRLADPSTLAMHWEAVAINADFWSQVLQAKSLKPLDFALGAVMVTPRKPLEQIGGFEALADCLADDYQLGNRIARLGYRIALCPVVAECWSAPMSWAAVWKHQLRWARTIRVCQPVPYFFSILSNPTLWPLIWLLAHPVRPVFAAVLACWFVRILSAADLQTRLTKSRSHLRYWWLAPVKDLLQTLLWMLAFAGNRVEWRGERMRLLRDGTLKRDVQTRRANSSSASPAP